MSNTALVPANSVSSLATTSGLEGFTITPSPMELVQRTTRTEGAVPGKFRDRDSGNHFDALSVVPLQFRITRVMFPPGSDFGADPICRSNDGVVPAENAAVPQCSRCDMCDHGPKMWAQWKKTKVKPDCQEKLQMLFIDRETNMPYYITFSGMSVGVMKRIAKSILKDIQLNAKKGNERHIFDYTFQIKPAFIQGGKGSYYVANVSGLSAVANPGEFGPLYEEFVLRAAEAEADQRVDDAIEGELGDEPVEA